MLFRSVAAKPVRLTVRRGQEVAVEVSAPSEIEGPIERGQGLGTAAVTLEGEPVAEIELVAARAAPEASVLERFDGAVPGPRAIAWAVAIGGFALILALALAIRDRRRR